MEPSRARIARRRPTVGLAILTLLLVFPMAPAGADGPAPASATADQAKTVEPSVDGRDLFTALYFGVGPLVEDLRSELQMSSYDRFVAAAEEFGPEQAELAEAIADALEENDPGIFEATASNLRSGDVFAVQEQLRTINAAIDALSADPLELRAAESTPDCLFQVAIYAAYVWDAAAAVNYGAAVNVAAAATVTVAVYVETYFWDNAPSSTSRLGAERAVADLAAALAADA